MYETIWNKNKDCQHCTLAIQCISEHSRQWNVKKLPVIIPSSLSNFSLHFPWDFGIWNNIPLNTIMITQSSGKFPGDTMFHLPLQFHISKSHDANKKSINCREWFSTIQWITGNVSRQFNEIVKWEPRPMPLRCEVRYASLQK